jgi:esterase
MKENVAVPRETVTLHYQELGSGPPLVILHGLFGSAANWRAVARGLAGRYRVILADLRNHGASPHAPSMDYRDQAADVGALLHSLGLERASLIGHSMGGKVAMTLALTAPERVERLVVVDIAPVRYPPSHDRFVRAMRDLDLSAVTRRADAEHELEADVPDLQVRQFLLQNLISREGRWRWRLNLDALAAERDAIYGFPDLDDSRYHLPALFVAGEQSDYVGEATHERIRTLFPAAVIDVVPGAGHWVHAEQPDAVRERIEPFLKG